MHPIKIQIAATFTSEPIGKSIEFLLGLLNLPVQLGFAPFNQVFQELLTPTSAFSQNTKGVNVVLVRLEDLIPETKQVHELAQNANELVAALKAAASKGQVPMLLAF